LIDVYLEAKRRNYSKIRCIKPQRTLAVTYGQLEYDFIHLLKKLEELKDLNPKAIEPKSSF
jgi:hypothetical protein